MADLARVWYPLGEGLVLAGTHLRREVCVRSSKQVSARNGFRRWLLWLWTLVAGLIGSGAGLLVLLFEHAPMNDTPAKPQEIFVFMQAAIILGVLAGVLSPRAWAGRRGSAALAALIGGVVFFIIISIRVIDAGNGTGWFFGCFTLPFLLVSILSGIFGSWIGTLLAEIHRGEE